MVAEFMSAHPDLKIELTLNDRFIDPIEEGVDVTVRIGILAEPRDSEPADIPDRAGHQGGPAESCVAGLSTLGVRHFRVRRTQSLSRGEDAAAYRFCWRPASPNGQTGTTFEPRKAGPP
jgi:hypothetical protein